MCAFAEINYILNDRMVALNFYLLLFVCQGLRVTALCGAIGTCAGAWIKVFSVHPDLFYVGFIGVILVSFVLKF